MESGKEPADDHISNHQRRFTDKQQLAMNIMNSGSNIFITGAGGVGKSYIINAFISDNSGRLKIGVTSMTGVSAILVKGHTLHSFLGIKLGDGTVNDLYDMIMKKSFIRSRWVNTNVLIIDEISMMTPILFDKLEHLARLIRKNNRPFGGIQLILSGDFLQLPPVNIGQDRKMCFDAVSWRACVTNTVYLTEIMRQSELVFQNFLNDVRIGNISNNVIETLAEIMDIGKLKNDLGIKPTHLYPHRVNAALYNSRKLKKLLDAGTRSHKYVSRVHPANSSVSSVAIDMMLKARYNGEMEITTCIGAQVMLLINMDVPGGLANGSRGVIVDYVSGLSAGIGDEGPTVLNANLPVVQFLNGRRIMIPEVVLDFKGENKKLMFSIKYMPLKIAYALTIHSCQGSTLDYAVMDLSESFEYGQVYVALSRVKNIGGLCITGYDALKIKALPHAVEFYNNLITENSKDEAD
jgi:ATP-dependent DNA helicase PIF1